MEGESSSSTISPLSQKSLKNCKKTKIEETEDELMRIYSLEDLDPVENKHSKSKCIREQLSLEMQSLPYAPHLSTSSSMSKLIEPYGQVSYTLPRRASYGTAPSFKNNKNHSSKSPNKLNLPSSRPPSLKSNGGGSEGGSFRSKRKGLLSQEGLESSFYRDCRSNSFAFSMDVKSSTPLRELPPKERRHRQAAYAVIIVSTLLFLFAMLCIVISLHFSSVGGNNSLNSTIIIPSPPFLNLTRINNQSLLETSPRIDYY